MKQRPGEKSKIFGVLYLPVVYAVLTLTGALMYAYLSIEQDLMPAMGEYIAEHGFMETGALNLVTAIYLGYRAFDTLGETIVLLLSVGGVLHFVRGEW